MYCTRCGTKLRMNASFCHMCGQRVKKRALTHTTEPSERSLDRFKQKIIQDERIKALRMTISQRLDRMAAKLSDHSPDASLARLSPERRQKILTIIKSLQTRLENNQEVEEIDEWTKSLEIRIEGSRCLVCLQDLTNSEERILACPHCHYPSHETHIISWIKMKEICPLCRAKISKTELILVK